MISRAGFLFEREAPCLLETACAETWRTKSTPILGRSFIATAARAARHMDRRFRPSPTFPATAFAESRVKTSSEALNPRLARPGISAANAARISSPRAKARTPSCFGWAVSIRRLPIAPKCTSGDRTVRRGSIPRINCRSGRKVRRRRADLPEEPRSGVSKDEWHQRGHMVRDGAARLLTMRI